MLHLPFTPFFVILALSKRGGTQVACPLRTRNGETLHKESKEGSELVSIYTLGETKSYNLLFSFDLFTFDHFLS